jgi:hypothetical protein
MPRSIVSQSDQFGLPQHEAAALPPESEMADLLSRPMITSGLLNADSTGYDQAER